MASVVFSAESADDVHSVNTRVKREGSHSGPLTSALNDHAQTASELDCDSSESQSDRKSNASVAIVSGGASKVSIPVTHLASSISSKYNP